MLVFAWEVTYNSEYDSTYYNNIVQLNLNLTFVHVQ